ncbi:hypothetical protein [Flagellimonas allohymeniacidonis]|uniref:Uncharacterized protein n=1 Tax=Flagellimonas allohymeniacidonis TaxID=2517819 RepID=A0A4Q8QBX1_9FLAO|nr:hypothetical protein [Allomuricauda hymeniacidonis]TAI47811.1 hypothetical protein EW142_14240 [Allomuricauda hymeniacidonis]
MTLKLGYIALSLLMTVILMAFAFKAMRQDDSKLFKKWVVILLGWHLYIFGLSLTGFIATLDFPPRFVLLTILPAFIFIGWSVSKIKGANWLNHIPPHWLIFYQIFRIGIETLFVFSVYQGILHSNVTLHGYNYDMVYAATALLIGWQVWRGNLKLGLIWNYLGLAVIAFIIFLFQTTIYFPEMYGSIEVFPVDFFTYPYILVAAFLMPSAVFVHVVSIIQLRQKLSQNKSS